MQAASSKQLQVAAGRDSAGTTLAGWLTRQCGQSLVDSNKVKDDKQAKKDHLLESLQHAHRSPKKLCT